MSSKMKQKKLRNKARKQSMHPTPKSRKKFPDLQMQWRPVKPSKLWRR